MARARLHADEVAALLELCDAEDVDGRRTAARDLCTCHVQADDERVWPKLLRLLHDDDVAVRRSALHAITDSTPSNRVAAVVDALEARYHEPDAGLRRRIRKTLSHYRRTGQITDAAR